MPNADEGPGSMAKRPLGPPSPVRPQQSSWVAERCSRPCRPSCQPPRPGGMSLRKVVTGMPVRLHGPGVGWPTGQPGCEEPVRARARAWATTLPGRSVHDGSPDSYIHNGLMKVTAVLRYHISRSNRMCRPEWLASRWRQEVLASPNPEHTGCDGWRSWGSETQ